MAAETIISVLSNVPWGQVIEAAPKVVDGATRLWNSVAKKKVVEEPERSAIESKDPINELKQKIDSLQSSVDQLKNEMQDASALIKSLAEQNTALIHRAELNRQKLQRQTVALSFVSAILVFSVAYLLTR